MAGCPRRTARLAGVLACLLGLAASGGSAQGTPVRGALVDAQGRPAAATVTLRALGPLERLQSGDLPDPAGLPASQTTPEGEFEVVAPSPGPWILEIQPPKGPALHGLLLLTDPLVLAPVELPTGRPFSLRVVDPDGLPLAARVALAPTQDLAPRPDPLGLPPPTRRRWSAKPLDLQVDTSGRLDVLLTEESWTLEVVAPGRVVRSIEIGTGTRQLEVPLEAGDVRRLRAVDPTGRGIPGLEVLAVGGLLPWAETDDSGRARLDLPRRIPRSLLWRKDGGSLGLWKPSSDSDSSADDGLEPQELRRVVTAPPPCSLQVVASESGVPIAEALVLGLKGSGEVPAVHGFSPSLTNRQGFAPWVCRDGVWAFGMAPGRGLARVAAPQGGNHTRTLALAPATELSGRVVDIEGFPLAGVVIELTARTHATDRRSRKIDEPRTVTGVDGRFTFESLPAGRHWSLVASLEGLGSERLLIEPFHQTTEDLLLTLRPAIRAHGSVVSEAGEPVAGARIEIRVAGTPRHLDELGRSTTTDAQGGFTFDGLSAMALDFEISRRGFAPQVTRGIRVEPGLADDAGRVDLGTFILAPGVAVEGRVVDTRGQPLPGVDVGLFETQDVSRSFSRTVHETPRFQATSGEDGRFRIVDLRAAEPFDLKARKEGYQETQGGRVEPPVFGLELTLAQSARLVGWVRDPNGEPVPGAAVVAWNDSGGRFGLGGLLGPRPRTLTDVEGRFELDGVPVGSLGVSVVSAHHPSFELTGLEIFEGETVDLEVELEEAAILTGRVRDARGRGVVGARLDLKDPDAEIAFVARGSADGAGRFEFRNLRPGSYRLTASGEQGREVSRDVRIRQGEQEIDLRFPAGVDVEGRVTDPSGGRLPGAVLRLLGLEDAGPRKRREIRSGGDGSFLLADVVPGDYRLEASKPGFARGTLDFRVESEPVELVAMTLEPGVALYGDVLGLEESALSRVLVRVVGYPETPVHPDFNGRYRIEHLAPGEVVVEATVQATGRTTRDRVKLPEGVAEVEHHLVFGTGLTLRGTATYGGRAATGAWVVYTGLSVPSSGHGVVDALGHFRLDDLRPGRYRIELLDHQQGARHRQEIDLERDDYLEIVIDGASVAGWVRDPAGAPLPGASIYLRPKALGVPAEQRGRSDSQGRFTLGQVAAGGWTLIALRPDSQPVEIPIWIEAGEPLENLEITLDPESP